MWSTRDLIQEALHSARGQQRGAACSPSWASSLALLSGYRHDFAHRRHPKQLGQQPGPQCGTHGANLFVARTHRVGHREASKLVPQIERIGIGRLARIPSTRPAIKLYRHGNKVSIATCSTPWGLVNRCGAHPIPRPSPNRGSRVALISHKRRRFSFTATNRMRWGKPSRMSNGEALIVGVIDGGSDSMGSLTLYMPRKPSPACLATRILHSQRDSTLPPRARIWMSSAKPSSPRCAR